MIDLATKEFFEQNKYLVIRNFISSDTALLLYQYSLIQTAAVDYKIFYDRDNYNQDWDGTFNDGQVTLGAFTKYGDPIMDSLLLLSLDPIKKYTGLLLNPNYSYWRLYQKGNVLERHKDRPSCEISSTLCLGYNVSNVDQVRYPDYNWPIWVQTENGNMPVSLGPGDLLIYRGCDIDHWREEFLGLNHTQVFLHYSDANGPYNTRNDGRPGLGLPHKTSNTGEKKYE
jgi:hypothetical protein